jgi:pilus assembly protein CpaD
MPAAKEPKVDDVQYFHAVRFLPDSSRLEGLERERLDDFLARLQAGPGDTIRVAGGGAGDARRVETITAYLVHRDLQPRVAAETSAEAPAPDMVSVIVERYAVTLPPCPDWSDRPGRTWNNAVSRNWGCATATNLGLMVAEPGDLVTGRDAGLMDGQFSVLAIQRYRAGKTRTLTPEDVGTIESQQKSGSGGEQ